MSAVQSHLETLPRGLQLALALGLVALLAFPFFGTDFYTQMVARMMILAIFAMSLDLLLGVTGLVSLGHAAYFGLADTFGKVLVPEAAGMVVYALMALVLLWRPRGLFGAGAT